MKTKIWRAANLLMLLMFLFSVVVQYNDPDPFLWMTIYALAELFAEFEMKGDLAVEVAREAGGLLIVAVWMQAIVIKRLLDRRHTSSSSRADMTKDVRG
jgi:hypothetical protein